MTTEKTADDVKARAAYDQARDALAAVKESHA